MTLVFVESSWLWLLPLVPLFWFLPRRATNRWHAAIRSAVAILLILALARPAIPTDLDDSYQVLIWDRSESVDATTTAAAELWAKSLPDSSRMRVVTLGGDEKTVPKIFEGETVRLEGSSVGRALNTGARLIPEGARGAVTVISDGMATDLHWGDAVRQLVERGIPVHTVAVANTKNDIYPSAIDSQSPLRMGQTSIVTVDVVGSAEEVVVSLTAGDEVLARSTPFAATGSSMVELEFEPSQAGLLDVSARVEVLSGTDSNPDNNQFASTLAVQEPIRALYLSERLAESREKISTLVGPGVEFSESSQAMVDSLAKDPGGIAAYDLVVIDDRPADSIPLPLQKAIVKAVQQDGVGLFYAGGKGAYGTGGYFDTPVASILPVEMIQNEEKRDPSTTLVVIIDTSGSMTGERVQLAKECARLAIRRLLPHDKVGIVEFYGTKQWAAPIQSAANAIEIQRAINRMDAGGGTVILPAIEEAFYAMQNVQTRYKHVLILTDGGVESGDFESLMRRMAAKGINVSTVLVGGSSHSEFLVNIANWGKGHFYSASDRFNIPEVLFKQPSTSKIPPYRPGAHFVSMGGPSGWWGEIPRPEKPQLSGYVETQLRPGAQVAVETETERHPILASWRHGLGRVSALTTEPVGEGTGPWREWDGYGAWLMRVLSRTSREHPQPFAYTIERSPGEARIIPRRLTPQLNLPVVEQIDEDGLAERVALQQRSPDLFTASISANAEETLHFRGGAEGWPGSLAHLVSPAWQAVAPEENVDPAKTLDLALLAATTGGESLSLDSVSRLDPNVGGAGTASDLLRLWPWCLLAALLCYLGDILYRRWPAASSAGARSFGLFWMIIGLGIASTPEARAEISPELEAELQRTLQVEAFEVDDEALYQAALVEDEALEPLITRLESLIQANDESFESIWLSASLQWRYGKLDEALDLFGKAAELRAEPLVFFRIAQILDSQGKTAEAAKQYQKALDAKPDETLGKRIQLRLALFKSTESGIEAGGEDLPAFAKTQDQAFRNRAGVVLALTGKPKEALELYKAAEEGNEAFKQLIRIAEWSMAANDMAKAQESAWEALRSAKLTRDRRYALTLLAEAYRNDGKLDQLIARFAATPDLSEEARMSWIELLREQGDADQALALFESAKEKAGDGFNADMRRELLDICREAGRNDLLVRNFEEMISKEPRILEWRSGLSRFYLERGERDKGIAVWDDYRKVAERRDWLAAADATMVLGLDQLATSFAEQLVEDGEGREPLAALQFIFDQHKARGQEDEMKAVLTRMDKLAAPDASDRVRLAESWEQLGRQDKAVEVLENLRKARDPEDFSSDLETRLAWLYSETGEEGKAFDAWKRVWLRIDSPGRRRYIEDRLMATASRLGKLADIAIELEEKLADGTADSRDSALLVRLYTRVGDPVSASEIIHDFMKLSGGTEIKMLEEQARVYVICNDYYHFEKTLRKLMELDPEGASEYLTQLAMSALERGRNDEAQAILLEMRGLETNPASAEFEAGVLKIAGMHEEANAAYWRGIGQHPDRIDAYLLLGESLQKLGKGKQAMGLFQYLVENAEKDDLFTIAVDGLLNMNNPRSGAQLTPQTLSWTRRAILERLAGKDDKLYLYQLLSDISEELRDQDMMIRAQAETLPIAGERRTPQLRELMELARLGTKNKDDVLRFGRRLIGMGEIIPPQVYLDLGSIFLENGDIRSAVKTFDNADDGLDQGGYRRKVASTFEGKRYMLSALRSYEKLLLTAPDDVATLTKVGEIRESLGRDDEAALAYRRALDVVMAAQPLFSFKEESATRSSNQNYYFRRNSDDFDKYSVRILTGLLATSDPGGREYLAIFDDFLSELRADVAKVEKERAAGAEVLNLPNAPRIMRRSELMRRLALAAGQIERAESLEKVQLKAFPGDKGLLPSIVQSWSSWGFENGARELVEAAPSNPGHKEAGQIVASGSGSVSRQIFQMSIQGDQAGTRAFLRDIEGTLGKNWSWDNYNALFGIARANGDSAAMERLVRLALNQAPKTQRLSLSFSLFPRVFPYLEQDQRDRLIAYLGDTLKDQGNEATGSLRPYSFAQFRMVTGGGLKLPIDLLRPESGKILGQGWRYFFYLGPIFSFLEKDDYQTLLRETYRKVKAEDRLGLLLSLAFQYPDEMDAATESLFSGLIGEAVLDTTGDSLNVYRNAIRGSFYRGQPVRNNLGFQARLLSDLGKRAKQKEEQFGFTLEEVRVWLQGDDAEQGAAVTAKLIPLAWQDDKRFTEVLTLLANAPTAYLDAALTSFDSIEKTEGSSVVLEKRRLQLVDRLGGSDRVFESLDTAIRKFPKEAAFRQELRRKLLAQGRYYEAMGVLKELMELEPDKQAYRDELRKAWTELAHPINAFSVVGASSSPKPAARKPTARPPRPVPAKPTVKAQPPKAGNQEKPLPLASTNTIKALYEAGEFDKARLEVRRLWRRFSAMDQASRSPVFRLPGPAHSRYFDWSAPTAPRTNQPAAPKTPAHEPGGLKAFLWMTPTGPPSAIPPVMRADETLFSAIGSEKFLAKEMATWLNTFKPDDYQGPHFEELLQAVVNGDIADQGAEPFVRTALAHYQSGAASTLDKLALLTALENHPEVGGDEAARFLADQLTSVAPEDLWQQVRLARCLAKRGEVEKALSLYRWCGANVVTGTSYYRPSVNANLLIDEIRRNLTGTARIEAIESVLSVAADDARSINARNSSLNFALSIWSEELAAHEVYQRCPDVCRKVIGIFESTSDSKTPAVDRATLFLAAAGETEEALKGLPIFLDIPMASGKFTPIGQRRHDQLLQYWLPQDMGSWTHADRWLAGVADQAIRWESGKKLPTAEIVKLLSLVAVRQHQNHFEDAARKTLAAIGRLSLTDMTAANWFIDAAEITGSDELAIETATRLLNEKRLPISRVAPLMKAVAAKQGVSAAHELAESALAFTWEREFLETMAKVCADAGEEEKARLWNERIQQAWSADSIVNKQPVGTDKDQDVSPGGDSFDPMAKATMETLRADPLLKPFDPEIFVARPFVVVMTRSPEETPEAHDARKRRIEDLARGIWRNWLPIRADWELRSTREDTPENPEPFVWLAFHDSKAYGQYMEKARTGKKTLGSKAFYSTKTQFVSFYEDPERDPSIITIHETFHQLMDRYSEIPSTKYRNYCFTEGLPEYFAGNQGEGETLVLGELNRPRRASEIRRIHTHFDDGKNISYPQHERQSQITPDDWIFYDVPMLLALRDPMWFKGISAALTEQFRRSDYAEKDFCKNFIRDGGTDFHSAFYAYAWAFTYWLNQNHPEEYRRYAMTVLNTDQGGDAESFLAAFNIQPVRPLPDIESLVGPNNRDVVANQKAAVACIDARINILRQTPAVQEMHHRWVEWMHITFPKLPEPGDPKPEEAYQQLRAAAEAKENLKALELGEAFLRTHPDSPEIANALHLAAMAGMASSSYDRAAPLLRQILDDHPDFDAIDEVRFKLTECLSGMRALEECIAQCRENLKVAPDSPAADYWRFLIPHSQFRLWRFKEAETGLQAFLKDHPNSTYAASARKYLDMINPPWTVDSNGLAPYSGKLEKDYRFKAGIAALPEHIQQAEDMIMERLGVDLDFSGTVNFIFQDAGEDNRGGLMAETFTICRDYKPVTVIKFYAEHVVTDPESYRTTVIHELKHAGYKNVMGPAYNDLPEWIVEGLAQWTADQLDWRMDSSLNSEVFAGKNPADLADGVANPKHDLGDYLEDVLAFEWMERHKPGSVREFAMGLIEGKGWSGLLAECSGLGAGEALRRMDLHVKERIEAAIGPEGREVLAIRDAQIAKGKQGTEVLGKWLREEGNRGYAKWLEKNPQHILCPVIRFYHGRGLILAGEHAQGREALRDLIDSSEVNTLVDDALFWEGYAFQQEKRMADAERSFGILLRDYSWSGSAGKVRGGFKSAGPEKKPGKQAD